MKEFFLAGEAADKLGISRSWLKKLAELEFGKGNLWTTQAGYWIFNSAALERVRKLREAKKRR